MAQLLKQPTPTPAGRFSQMLPSVKCSSCGRPVPVDELGDHICPPTPSVPTLPRPQHSPQSATALLPPRLQNLATSPISPSFRSPVHAPSPLRSSPAPRDPRAFQSTTLPPVSPNPPWNHPVPDQRVNSPLARSHHQQIPTSPHSFHSEERAWTPSAPHPDHRFERREVDRRGYPQPQPSPIPSPLSGRVDSRTAQPTTRVPYDHNARTASPQGMPRENEIDTQIGGEAGMAGVGRRGFAAAARAAMFAPLHDHSPPSLTNDNKLIPGMDGRRANAPRYLDIDASRCESSSLFFLSQTFFCVHFSN
jgi:hypothetical protein